MRRLNGALIGLVAVLGAILFALALILVNFQYRSRTLFVEHERAIEAGRKILDDQAELEYKVRKAGLPGNIVAEAEKAGLVPSTEEESVTLVYARSGRVVDPEEAGAGESASVNLAAEKPEGRTRP